MKLIWTVVFFGIITGAIGRNINHSVKHRLRLSEPTKAKPERIVCETQQCKELAKTLIESMNHAVDPCEDFYEYACGNWGKHNPLPEGVPRWNLLRKSQKRVIDRLKVIVEEGPQPDDIHGAKFAKRAFTICTNTDAMDKEGLQPLLSTLWRAGGWPMIMEEDEWDEDIYKWQNVDDYYALLIGENGLHNVHVDIDYWNGDKMYLYIKTPNTLASMYKILNTDELSYNYEEEEGSQERGSEERDDDNSMLGEHEFSRRRGSAKRILDQLMQKLKAKKRLEKAKRRAEKAKGRIHGTKQMKKDRTKRSLARFMNLSKWFNKKPTKNMIIPAKELSNHRQKLQLHNVKKISNLNSLRNSERIATMNDDLYFDNTADETSNNQNYIIDEREDVERHNVEDDTDDDMDSGSGSGDDEQDDEDDSGDDTSDGDYGSGSGDENDENDEDEDDTDDDEGEDSREEKKRKIEEARSEYAEYILNVSLALANTRGVPVSKEKLAKEIIDLIEFQVEIMEYAFMFGNEKRMRLGTLQRRYEALKPKTRNGKINWTRKVQDLFNSGGMEIDEKTYVTVESFDYIMALRSLLDKTSSRTIVNYIHWNFISRVLKATTKEMRKLHHSWDRTEMNDKLRMKECVEEIQAKYIAGYEYVKRYVPDEILQTASDMVDDIQKEVEQEIKNSPWMDAKIRHMILDKLVYMKRAIGYPDSYRNKTIMKEHFKGLSVTNSHYENTLSLMRYMKWENLKIFHTKELPQEVDMNPLIVNAFFSPFDNTIEITAADFQNPLYDVNQPWYTNYGIIGLIMSHEVNHGFDNSGRFFDKLGGRAIWTLDMLDEYDKRAQCFIDQFTRYSVVENKTANISIEDYGEQTAGENIADSMGLNSVFKAYQRRLRECDKPDPMLPGLEDLSNEQLFFLSFANTWCEVTDPEKVSAIVKRDPHSVGPLRVIGSVSNSKDFAKAYNCPADSPMNPTKKCNIWV